jgi:hypothetical protein
LRDKRYKVFYSENLDAGDHLEDRSLDGKAIITFFSLALQPPWALASVFQVHDHFTDGRTPWTSDQLVAKPLP